MMCVFFMIGLCIPPSFPWHDLWINEPSAQRELMIITKIKFDGKNSMCVITQLSVACWIVLLLLCLQFSFLYETSRFQLIYSHFNVLVGLSKPKAVALVRRPSALVLSVSASGVVSGSPDHNTGRRAAPPFTH